jgi:membrane-anchored glycerophosphoryl diester phosphodiesterase (GDPDase)
VLREGFSWEKRRGLSDLFCLSEDTSPTFRFLFSIGKLTSLKSNVYIYWKFKALIAFSVLRKHLDLKAMNNGIKDISAQS